jgi:Cys-tRNA(Pro)/Cys-tRNA(Cys) deacylase
MTTATGPDGPVRVGAAAEALGLDVRFRERPAARSLEEAAALLGIEPADVVKSLVVRLPDRTHLFVLVDGTSSLAWPRLRALLGVNKLSMPSAADALAATGYERGTITPVGSEPAWPVVVDSRLRGRTVAMGAGVHGWSAFVAVDDLVEALGATVADVADVGS